MAKRGTKADVKWNGKQVMFLAHKNLRKNAWRAGAFLEGKVIRSISRGQKTKRVGSRLVGLNPSRPGRPPKVLHGLLRNSIAHRTDVTRQGIDVYVGANTKYARRLELGDAYGPLRGSSRIEARPYLRPAIESNRAKALRILFKGIFE